MRQDFTEAIRTTIHNEILASVHTCAPGKVVSYDPSTGLATIDPLAYTLYNGVKAPYPRLYSVPVIFPAMGQIAFSVPIAKNDEVLVVFCERCLGEWEKDDAFPETGSFSMGNAIALPGFYYGPTGLKVKAQQEGSLIIRNGDVQIEVLADKIKITGDIEIDGTVTYVNSEGGD